MLEEFDVVVIGGGAAGEVLAGRTATAGLRTAIVESELVGGECSYWACIPSKALLKPQAVRNSAGKLAGVRLADEPIDAEAVLTHRDEAISNFDDSGQVKWLDGKDVALFRGFARLDGERRVLVASDDGETTLAVNQAVVIATGSAANIPPIEGAEENPPWDSRDATTAKAVPSRLAIIGGGVVAVEMAQAWSSLGTQVTVLVRDDSLLHTHEPFVGELLAKAFERDGIDLRFGVSAQRIDRQGDAAILHLDNGESVEVDEYLVATGRRPRTNGIGLDTVGLAHLEGEYVEVDDHLRVKNIDGDWLYAIGDVNGRSLLTHMGKYQGRIAAGNITGADDSAWADNGAVPGVIFTDPQVANVGLTEQEAKATGRSIKSVHFDITQTAAGWLNGDQVGGAKLVIDEHRSVIVGATFVGSGVDELLHSATIAIVGEVPLDKLWHAVPSFPTLSEVWLSLLEQYGL